MSTKFKQLRVTMPNQSPQLYDVDMSSLAEDFSPSSDYVAGQYVYQNGKMYRFKVDHPAGDWNASHAVEVNAGDELEAIRNDVDEKSGVIFKTLDTPAAIQSFDDGADDLPIKEMKIGIEPQQDLHGYDHPWPAGGGKNIAKFADQILDNDRTQNGITFHALSENIVRISGLATDTAWLTNSQSYEQLVTEKHFYKAGTYILSSNLPRNNNCSVYMVGFEADGTVISGNIVGNVWAGRSVSFTRGTDFYANIQMSITSGADFTTPVDVWVQLEIGSTATNFAPYSNICPITGWTGANVSRTGVNVWDEEWEQGNIDVTTGQNTSSNIRIRSKNYISIKPNTTYDFYGKWFGIYYYDENKNFLGWTGNKGTTTAGDHTFTTRSDASYIRFRSDDNYGGTYQNDASINYPSTETGYHAYSGNEEYSITFPSSAGTVYGGNLTVEQDGSGTLVVDRYHMTVAANTTCAYISSDYGHHIVVDSGNHIAKYRSDRPTIICSICKSINWADRITSPYTSELRAYVNGGQNTDVILRLPAGVSALNTSDVLQYFIGAQLCWELATPNIYHLTAPEVRTLLGANNIYADTGSINSITYRTNESINYELNKISDTDIHTTEIASVAQFETDSEQYAKGYSVGIEPVQDLHGYDHPWPAGGGKNLLQCTANSQEINGATFTVKSDGTVSISGNVSTMTDYKLADNIPLDENTYIINGCPENGGVHKYRLWVKQNEGAVYSNDDGNGASFSVVSGKTYSSTIRIWGGYGNGLVFKPMIRLASVSDATFAPYSNICPITGWTGANVTRTGKNLLDVSKSKCQYNSANGSITSAGGAYNIDIFTNAGGLQTPVAQEDLFRLPYLKAGTYNISYSSNPSTKLNIVTVDRLGQIVNPSFKSIPSAGGNLRSTSFTLNEDTFISFRIEPVDAITLTQLQLEVGSSATSFEPYSGESYPISLPSSAGTVYGGNLTVEQDGSGTLVVDRAYVNIKNAEFSGGWGATSQTDTHVMLRVNGTSNFDFMNDRYSHVCKGSIRRTAATGGGYRAYRISDGSVGIATPKTILQAYGYDGETVESAMAAAYAFEAALPTDEYVYPITNPITYHLTAPQVKLLKGLNNLWADSGDISVTYRDGAFATLDEETAIETRLIEAREQADRVEPTQGMIAHAETLTATSNHAIGDIFVCGDQLLRATASIASGETINTGTGGNAEIVTVAGLFTELLGQLTTLSGAVNTQASDLVDLNDYVHLMHEGVVYGFRIDSSVSDPSNCVTYLADAKGMTPAHMDYSQNVFNYGSWENAFFMPKPCMLKYDGTVDYYLDPNDYSKKEDGTASDVADSTYGGNAMMEWGQNGKKIWYAIVPDSNDNTCANIYIADHQIDDRFHAWSFVNGDNQYVDHFYTPCYFGTLVDGTLRSLSGQSGANRCKRLNASGERTAAKANNPSGVDIWDTEVYADITIINLLLVLIGKSLNTQTVFGEGLHTNGSDSVNNSFTSGQHDSKGMFYGTNSGAAATYTNAVKVFGMENWWGYQWRRYMGHVSIDRATKYKMTRGNADGSMATDYAVSDSASAFDGYLTGSVVPTSNGNCIDKMTFDGNQMVPKSVSGSVRTHYADGLWTNTGTRFAYRGGYSAIGSYVGAFCLGLRYFSSDVGWDFGAAPSCKPLAPTI